MVSGIELISVLRLAHKLIVGLISNARLANNIIPKAEELEDRIVRLIEIFNNHISEEDGEIMSRYYYLIKDEIIPFFERFNKKGRIKKFVNVRDVSIYYQYINRLIVIHYTVLSFHFRT